MLKACVTAALLSIPPLVLMRYLNYKCKHLTQVLQELVDSVQFKFMFVTHKNRLCNPHLNTHLVCGSYCSFLYLKNIINIINSAKSSLSLCMYHISIDDLQSALVNAHHRGVHIRVITDSAMVSTRGSKTSELCGRDIPVKMQTSKVGLMHHKYMLIDENDPVNCRVLYGSLNYTVNAIINNWEYVALTNSREVIGRFTDEFNYLWSHDEFVSVIKVR